MTNYIGVYFCIIIGLVILVGIGVIMVLRILRGSQIVITKPDDNEKTIRKLKKEKERLLNKIHGMKIPRDGEFDEVPDEVWAALADIDNSVRQFSEKLEVLRETRNHSLPREMGAVLDNIASTLSHLK